VAHADDRDSGIIGFAGENSVVPKIRRSGKAETNMNTGVILRGQAADSKETLAFSIERFISGGFLLGIQYSGDCHEGLTGAGVWPSIEKAKDIAQRTATHLLHGALVVWEESAESITS
jgi:hypothetical protein